MPIQRHHLYCISEGLGGCCWAEFIYMSDLNSQLTSQGKMRSNPRHSDRNPKLCGHFMNHSWQSVAIENILFLFWATNFIYMYFSIKRLVVSCFMTTEIHNTKYCLNKPRNKRNLGSSGGRVVKLLACGARGPGFDSRPRHLNFQRLVISCFQVEIWLKNR